jgi:hypothetical protein
MGDRSQAGGRDTTTHLSMVHQRQEGHGTRLITDQGDPRHSPAWAESKRGLETSPHRVNPVLIVRGLRVPAQRNMRSIVAAVS